MGVALIITSCVNYIVIIFQQYCLLEIKPCKFKIIPIFTTFFWDDIKAICKIIYSKFQDINAFHYM